MASKVKKGFFYYILWFLFIVIGILCIFASILIMNPGKDIFGINLCWLHDSAQQKFERVDDKYFSALSISTIEFNSKCTDIYIVRDSEYQVMTIELNKNVLGFSEPVDTKYEFKMTHSGTTLKIDITEPILKFALSGNSSVTIHCPMDKDFNDIAFKINSKQGSCMFGAKEAKNKFSVKDIDANIENGNFSIYNNVDVLSDTLDIVTKSSSINIYSDIISNVNITTENSSVKIDKISGNLSITANELKVDAKKILGNIKISSSTGYIKIDELGDFSNQTGGNFTSEIDKAHIANIIIGKMRGILTLPSAQKSDITINELRGEALISTTSGNVKITNAYDDLSITTTSGSVNFTQNSNTATNYISTISGKIYARFNNIKNSELKSEKGSINVYVKDGLDFAIEYDVGKSINVSWIKNTKLSKKGTVYSPMASSSPTSKIVVLTNAYLNVTNFQ